MLQQARIEEPRDVVVLALGQHDPVHASPGGSVGYVALAHARPGQVAGQHDDALGGPAQVRVACGLSQTPAEAIGFYRLMSGLAYLPSSPTLFNSATPH